jgi:hypothetical protein
MTNEKSPPVFGVYPINVLVQAYKRRIEQADPAHNDTIMIERSLLDDLIGLAESSHTLQMADGTFPRCRIVIEGEKNHFRCNIEHLNDDGGSWLNAHANGKSVLESFLAATIALKTEIDKLIQ